MKTWISMLIIFLLVATLCVWDGIYTDQTLSQMEEKANYIYEQLQVIDITNQDIQDEIANTNNFWTKKMDTLCISISRKDLQPVSDYLQYLIASIENENQEDAVTYSRILYYNTVGLKQSYGINFINLL